MVDEVFHESSWDQKVDDIMNRLQFKISFDSEEVKQAIYFESSLKGNSVILANTEGEEGKLDLEMLYKAIVSNKEGVQSAFK